jgi:hypothetical protein
MRGIGDGLRAGEPSLRTLTPELALAAVGGVNEIVMRAIETGPVEAITELAEVATDLWAAVLTAPAG